MFILLIASSACLTFLAFAAATTAEKPSGIHIGYIVLSIIIAAALADMALRVRKKLLARMEGGEHAKKEPEIEPDRVLPQGNFWLGILSETRERAMFNQDDLTGHVMVAGATGSGKSLVAMVIAEEALKHRIPVVVFDPTGQWTGFMQPCRDRFLLDRYREFGMNVEDVKSFQGMIHEISDPNAVLDFQQYLNPGEITIFTLTGLKSEEYAPAISNILNSIHGVSWNPSTELSALIVFDEIHRLLEKYGGGGYEELEKAVRYMSEHGAGLILTSHVLVDFGDAIRSDILTEIQLHTKSTVEIGRIKEEFGEKFSKKIVAGSVGIGMIRNPKYNLGEPYFIQFRPLFHSPHRIPDEDLSAYIGFEKKVNMLQHRIKELSDNGVDTSEMELHLKFSRERMKQGMIRMAEVYIESVEKKLEEESTKT